MADNILILGNGFDLAMKRNTKYEDFLDFAYRLRDNSITEDETRFLTEKFGSLKEITDKANKNLFLDYMFDNKDKLGEGWANIETVISDIAIVLSEIKNNSNIYFAFLRKGPRYLELDTLEKRPDYIWLKFVLGQFDYKIFDEGIHFNVPRKLEIVESNFLSSLNDLTDLLEIYLSYLDYQDFEINKIQVQPTVLSAITDIEQSRVINFNYTNTAQELFGISEENIHFIHGRIDIDRQLSPINTMVFGIEDKNESSITPDLIPYQKYYQRIIKETGNQFEKFFKMNENSAYDVNGEWRVVPKNILVFGHSVDPLDKEIFQKCFKIAEGGEAILNRYRFIFTYYDEIAKHSIVKNLAIILGKEKIIELTGNGKIKFVKSDDVDGMREVLLSEKQ
ncbi:AbiH family protein [Streptococcus sobrinus]|uniref:AbiH family protein n=1 Tax=Streptococcus sobrinus TaxID=1310 RepID=UPI0002D98EC2|nr:AbiH family protein [Streptococcus sobrinus]AWN18763.1 hypothetical protein DK181_04630 [Streptococcus sobrinus]